ncbi:amidohydrolase family protein [Pseudomonadota bacterium]
MKRLFGFLCVIALCFNSVQAAELSLSRVALTAKWQARVQALLDQGKLPLIDMETSLQAGQVDDYVPGVFSTMDELAIAMMSPDGYQDAKDAQPGDKRGGYRWSTYILDLVNTHPDHFIPTANGGTNNNWLKQKGGNPTDFVDQMEAAVRTGQYFSMGELDFRHYMSGSQCKKGKTERDSSIALNSANGHRIFKLSAETQVPFVVHLEPEDTPLAQLEEMLAAYPAAKVIVAHFGQIRHPNAQTGFTPALVRRLLETYPNLTYDLANGEPNRKYKCSGLGNDQTIKADNALWQGQPGKQRDTLKPEYLAILAEFSTRFVFATDYGGGRKPLPQYLRDKHANFSRLIGDLPEDARHNIAYRNAWKLLTGKTWANREATR